MGLNAEEAKFPNTVEGRSEAEEYDRSIGGGGYWEPHVETDNVEAKTFIDEETKILLAVASVAINNPEAFRVGDLSIIGTKLAQRGIHVPVLPVDVSAFAGSMPMQPGEASWASWKCGGGPHAEDRPA